jgi:hypothetical protein
MDRESASNRISMMAASAIETPYIMRNDMISGSSLRASRGSRR